MSSLYSWSRFAFRTAANAAGAEGCPTKLNFIVTKRCHSRCTYCDIWKIKETPGGLDGELTLDEVKAVASANPFLQWIDFTGGEPTDRPDFPQIVQAFALQCPDLLLAHFPTNGIATKRITEMVTEIRRTVRARLVVSVSIDGPPELNDLLRGIRNDFAHAVDTFASVRHLLGPDNVFIGMTLHGHKASCGYTTSELIEQTFAAINDALRAREETLVGWSALHLNIPHFSQHYYGNIGSRGVDGFGGEAHRGEIAAALRLAALKPSGTGILPVSGDPRISTGKMPVPHPDHGQDARATSGLEPPATTGRFAPIVMRVIERIYRAEAMRYLAQGRTSVICSALQSTVYLSEKGEVYPCTIWNKPLGNVRNTGYALMPIIEAARRSGVRQTIIDRRCPNCWTPCEAYPSILASPLRSASATLTNRRSKSIPAPNPSLV
jgi:sulfatase maturation enzyme AslB (radical SAM superfamily)